MKGKMESFSSETLVSTGVMVAAMYFLKLIVMLKTATSPSRSQYPKLGKDLRKTEFDHLDQNTVFCNCGAWGCVPKTLISRQMEMIKLRERNPHWYIAVIAEPLYKESMAAISKMVGANPENLTLIESTTTGINTVMKLQKYLSGDKILIVNLHTYPAVMIHVKSLVKNRPGVEMICIDIPFPIKCKDDILTPYAKALEEHPEIKITIVDHITSATAILMPIKEIIELCHRHDVIVVIDGAHIWNAKRIRALFAFHTHTPGQLNLSIEDYGADFYVGNLSKWMMTPGGVGFLWVHPKHQAAVSPLVTSLMEDRDHFIDRFYSPMTKDMIPHVLVKDAVNFFKDLGGLDNISHRNSSTVTEASKMLSEAWDTPQLDVKQELRAPFMAVVGFPIVLNTVYEANDVGFSGELTIDLLKKGTDVKSIFFDGRFWCRISCNVWNDREDYEKVRDDVLELIKEKGVSQKRFN